jgi:NTP pyrophosphatase (non-canonical NTP hydrolase)
MSELYYEYESESSIEDELASILSTENISMIEIKNYLERYLESVNQETYEILEVLYHNHEEKLEDITNYLISYINFLNLQNKEVPVFVNEFLIMMIENRCDFLTSDQKESIYLISKEFIYKEGKHIEFCYGSSTPGYILAEVYNFGNLDEEAIFCLSANYATPDWILLELFDNQDKTSFFEDVGCNTIGEIARANYNKTLY